VVYNTLWSLQAADVMTAPWEAKIALEDGAGHALPNSHRTNDGLEGH